MNSTSKAQIQQTFVFILFIIVAGFVIVLGYNALTSIQEGQEGAEKIRFKQDIVNFFENYDSYGELHHELVNLPPGYNSICFVNSSATGSLVMPYETDLPPNTNQQVLETALNSRNNIFIIGEFTEPVGYSEKVLVPSGPSGDVNVLCVEGSGGKVDLLFRGRGGGTLVEEG